MVCIPLNGVTVIQRLVSFHFKKLTLSKSYFAGNKKIVLEAVAWRCSLKMLFLRISQKSQENTCAGISV